ncbi:MAG: HlyD family efflux transporter periplasmic adaptor subunit [Pirellulaceae bacterium]|nr:HlyD family efflux transporter periplasmic adaptor subunit [Pirellulaceae bacterium]
MESDPQLQAKLLDAVSGKADKASALAEVIRVICDQHSSVSVLYLERTGANALTAAAGEDTLQRLPLDAREKIGQWAGETCQSGSALVHELSGANQWIVVTVPVVLRGRAPEVICAAAPKNSLPQEQLVSVLQLAASNLTLWEVIGDARRERVASQQTAALLELLSQLDDTEDWTTACCVLVNELSDYLGCDQVALAMTKTDQVHCKLAAVSGLSDFDKRSAFTAQIEAVMNEAILRDSVTVISDQQDRQDEGTLAHRDFQRGSRSHTLISTPIYGNDGQPVGAWLLLDNRPDWALDDAIAFVRASQNVVGSRLEKLQRTYANPLLRRLRAFAKIFKSRKVIGSIAACIFFAAVMMIPMNYRISCDCQLEPVSRRFVAAPYDGTLQESLVEAGEVVSSGQTLARMDARELRWEMSGYQADYESERKKRDAASARDEVAMAQQSDLEMQRLSVQIQLIQHRLDNLEIKSPVDGVVIVGDLKKAEGVPLTIGQTMFEIGPLDEMIVEVAVPESEILYVKEGMEVGIRLDADQSDKKTGSIIRIAPRSETRDNQSVYIAEVAMDNADGTLRPGMKGSAKVIGDPNPLGWNLFHKAWESFAMMVGV